MYIISYLIFFSVLSKKDDLNILPIYPIIFLILGEYMSKKVVNKPKVLFTVFYVYMIYEIFLLVSFY